MMFCTCLQRQQTEVCQSCLVVAKEEHLMAHGCPRSLAIFLLLSRRRITTSIRLHQGPPFDMGVLPFGS